MYAFGLEETGATTRGRRKSPAPRGRTCSRPDALGRRARDGDAGAPRRGDCPASRDRVRLARNNGFSYHNLRTSRSTTSTRATCRVGLALRLPRSGRCHSEASSWRWLMPRRSCGASTCSATTSVPPALDELAPGPARAPGRRVLRVQRRARVLAFLVPARGRCSRRRGPRRRPRDRRGYDPEVGLPGVARGLAAFARGYDAAASTQPPSRSGKGRSVWRLERAGSRCSRRRYAAGQGRRRARARARSGRGCARRTRRPGPRPPARGAAGGRGGRGGTIPGRAAGCVCTSSADGRRVGGCCTLIERARLADGCTVQPRASRARPLRREWGVALRAVPRVEELPSARARGRARRAVSRHRATRGTRLRGAPSSATSSAAGTSPGTA